MSPRSVDVQHRLYAYGADKFGGPGGHNVPLGSAEPNVPPHVLRMIDDLLESIAPAGKETAYAVQRFGGAGEGGSFVCLVASEPSLDAIERPASLNHARILRIDSADALLDVHALVELAAAFEAESAQLGGSGVEAIRERLFEVESSVRVAEWSDAPLLEVAQPLAQSVVEMCVSRFNRDDAEIVPVSQQPALQALRGVAAVWASLPLAIQRASPFAIDSLRGTRAKLLFMTKSAGPKPDVAPRVREFAATYVEWLRDCPDDVRFLVTNPAITDVQSMFKEFERAKLPIAAKREFEHATLPIPIEPEEPEMTKKKPPPEAPRGELNQAMIRYINEQVGRAEESLKDYVDRWMSSSEVPARRTASGVQPVGAPSSVRPGRRFGEMAMASAPGAVAGAVMALLVVFLMRPHAPAATAKPPEVVEAQTASAPSTTRDTPPAVQPATPTPADKLPGEDWAHRFQYLSEKEPRRLSALATSIAAYSPLSGQAEKSFTAITGQLNAGKALGPQDSKLLRVILFQMLAHQLSGQQITIDGKYGPGTAVAIPAIRDALKLESKAATADDIANLQAEAILRWAARDGL